VPLRSGRTHNNGPVETYTLVFLLIVRAITTSLILKLVRASAHMRRRPPDIMRPRHALGSSSARSQTNRVKVRRIPRPVSEALPQRNWPVFFHSAMREKWYWKYKILKKKVITPLSFRPIGSAVL